MQEEREWPLIEPLLSYGRGRDAEGGRYASLIFGTNLTDVIITGMCTKLTGKKWRPFPAWWTKERLGMSSAFGTSYCHIWLGSNFFAGNNGTIDGQGAVWWDKFHNGELNYTRPYLIEIMYSDTVQISHLTLLNSPSWNVHPVYSRFLGLSLQHSAFNLEQNQVCVLLIMISRLICIQQCDCSRHHHHSASAFPQHRWDQPR